MSAVRVELVAHVPEEYRDRFERCRSLFEDYCVVAESLRHGIPVEVAVSVPPS
jgi:organic hydroperoxide reductase OsmC/OhrA